MAGTVTIAHLTDVHLGPIAGFTPRYWNLKRLAGYINWRRKRSHVYLRSTLDRLIVDMRAQAPDHVVVTGDLVNIGLPHEHIAALAWLEGLGRPAAVTAIPGNHDIYSSLHGDPGTGRWCDYMRSDAPGTAFAAAGADFPFVRLVGSVALVGVNTAVPTPPLIAWGRIGKAQLDRLAETLERLGRARHFRLVLVHHPPLPGQSDRWRGLADAVELRDVLQRHGAELVIHGHNHRNTLAWARTPGGLRPVVGAGPASLGRPYRDEPLARYNLYRIEGPPWAVELEGRGLAEPEGPVVQLERRALAPDA